MVAHMPWHTLGAGRQSQMVAHALAHTGNREAEPGGADPAAATMHMQGPREAALPANPALDVRGEAVFRKDAFVLGKVHELSDERLKSNFSALSGAMKLIARLKVVRGRAGQTVMGQSGRRATPCECVGWCTPGYPS